MTVTRAWGLRSVANLEQTVKVVTFGLGSERQNGHAPLGGKNVAVTRASAKGLGYRAWCVPEIDNKAV